MATDEATAAPTRSKTAPAWAVKGKDGTSCVHWDAPGDRFLLTWYPAHDEPVAVAEADNPGALSLPSKDPAEPGMYAVVALKDGKVQASSAVGTGDAGAKAQLGSKLAAWKKWRELAPQDPDRKTAVGDPVTDEVDGATRTTQSYKLTRTPEEIVTFNPNINELYPGAIVRSADAISDGQLVLAGISPKDRTPLMISVDALVSTPSETVSEPSYGTVLSAIKRMVQGGKLGARDIVFRKTEGYSSTETALELGVSGKYGGFSASLKIDAKRSSKMNTVVAYLRERAFTASCNLGTPDSYIADTFTEQDLTQLVSWGYTGPTNPPLIVSNVVYGRILMFSFTSKETETDINAALQASYSGFADIDTKLKAKYQSVLREGKIDIIARGGPGKDVQKVIVDGDLKKYFEEAPPLESYTIIGYTLHTLDGRPAKMSESTDYDRVNWAGGSGYSVTINIDRVYASFFFGRDGDDVEGTWIELDPADVIVDGQRTDGVKKTHTASGKREFNGQGVGQPFRIQISPDSSPVDIELSPHAMGWFTHGENHADGYVYGERGWIRYKVHYSASR